MSRRRIKPLITRWGTALLAFSACAVAGPAFARAWKVPEEVARIQDAIDGAALGDSILIAPGTYRAEDGRLSITRGPLTIIGVEGPGSTVIDAESTYPLRFNAVAIEGTDAQDITVEGLTLQGGRGQYGGALKCMYGASATVLGCRLTKNGVAGGSGFSAAGLGVLCEGARLRMRSCVVEDNDWDAHGGAIACRDWGSVDVEDCVFRNNVVSGGGGAVFAENGGEVKLTRVWIQGNSAVNGGGILCWVGGRVSVHDCLITGNRTVAHGGGIANVSWMEISGTTIAWNDADGQGGGYYQNGATGTMERSIIWGNCAWYRHSDSVFNRDGEGLHVACSVVDTSGVFEPSNLVQDGLLIVTDPFFCEPGHCAGFGTTDGDYRVTDDSPCVLAESECGGRIGVLGAGCDGRTGACCLPGGSCTALEESVCRAQAGRFLGPKVPCTDTACDLVPTLRATWGSVKARFGR